MEVILTCVWLLLITVYFFYLLYIVIKWFFNKVKSLFNHNLYKKINTKKKEKVKKVEDSINDTPKKEIVTNEVKEEKQELKTVENMTKEELIESAESTISECDKILNKYNVDNLKVIVRDTENSKEYILTGINASLYTDLILSRLSISVEKIDSTNSTLRISFKNNNSISLASFNFSHDSKSFKILKKTKKIVNNNYFECVFAVSMKKNGVTWLKLSNFNTNIDKIYISLMKHFPVTFSEIEWNVKHGDFVNVGDTIFTAKSKMLSADVFNFVSPKNGYIVFDKQKCNSMKIKTNDKIVGISEVKPTITQKGTVYDGTNGYYDEYEITSPIHKGKQYIKVPILGSEKYFIHPQLKINNVLFSIIDWLRENGSFYNIGVFATSPDETQPHVFINNDYTIDVKCRHTSIQIKNDGKLPDFINFNEIEGDFGIDFYPIAVNVITTLRGCPVKVSGNFDCERNELTSFEGSPLYVGGDFVAKSNKLSSFMGMPKYIGGCFNISNNEFDDASWEYAKENIEGEFFDYNISNNPRLIKYGKKLY